MRFPLWLSTLDKPFWIVVAFTRTSQLRADRAYISTQASKREKLTSCTEPIYYISKLVRRSASERGITFSRYLCDLHPAVTRPEAINPFPGLRQAT